MYDAGYQQQTAVDISQTVIKNMEERQGTGGGRWQQRRKIQRLQLDLETYTCTDCWDVDMTPSSLGYLGTTAGLKSAGLLMCTP